MELSRRVRAYTAVGLASGIMVAGGVVGYEHFTDKTAPADQACADKYLGQADLFQRCEDDVPFSGGRSMMETIVLVGTLGMAGSGVLTLNAIRKER